jgi:hypothetical protein
VHPLNPFNGTIMHCCVLAVGRVFDASNEISDARQK